MSPLTKTAVGAEISHKISKNEHTFIMSIQHAFDPLAIVKVGCDNHGKVDALIQHEWSLRSLIIFSREVDNKVLDTVLR
jgi:voltage-dependent anion channel protein 2